MMRKTQSGHVVELRPHIVVKLWGVHDPEEAERRRLDVKMLLRAGAKGMPEEWRRELGRELSLATLDAEWRELVDTVRKGLCPTPDLDRMLGA